jgi:hypothetical protein
MIMRYNEFVVEITKFKVWDINRIDLRWCLRESNDTDGVSTWVKMMNFIIGEYARLENQRWKKERKFVLLLKETII